MNSIKNRPAISAAKVKSIFKKHAIAGRRGDSRVGRPRTLDYMGMLGWCSGVRATRRPTADFLSALAAWHQCHYIPSVTVIGEGLAHPLQPNRQMDLCKLPYLEDSNIGYS
jgi:hypothetical protein